MKRLDGNKRDSITMEQSKKVFDKFGDDIIQKEVIDLCEMFFAELKLNLLEQFDNHGWERYNAKKEVKLILNRKW